MPLNQNNALFTDWTKRECTCRLLGTISTPYQAYQLVHAKQDVHGKHSWVEFETSGCERASFNFSGLGRGLSAPYQYLNNNSIHCYIFRFTKDSDTCKWGGLKWPGILQSLLINIYIYMYSCFHTRFSTTCDVSFYEYDRVNMSARLSVYPKSSAREKRMHIISFCHSIELISTLQSPKTHKSTFSSGHLDVYFHYDSSSVWHCIVV